jgi:hypothetical protein
MQVFFPEPFRKIHSTQVTWSGPFRAGGAADLHLGPRRCNKINWKLSKVSLMKAWPSWYCILFVLIFVVFDCFCLQRSIQNHGVSNDLCFQPLLGTTIQTDNPGTVGCPSKSNSQISTPWCFRAHHVLFQIYVRGPDGRATVHTLGPVLHLGILPREVVEATGLKAPTDHEACWAQCLGFTLIIHYIINIIILYLIISVGEHG